MKMRVVTIWRRELVNINKTRDNHLARFGIHFNHTLLVRDDKPIGPHIESYGTNIYRIKPGSFGFVGFWIKALQWLRTNHSKNAIDAIIIPIGEEPLMLPIRLLFGNRTSRPSLILNLWDVPGLALEGSDQTLLKATTRKIYLWLLPKIVKSANIVISGVVSQPFLTMGISQSRIIDTENGVNVDKFKPTAHPSDLWLALPPRASKTVRLLYQGYLHEARGSIAMINMVSKLRNLGYDAQLLLVGPSEPGQISKLKKATAENYLEKFVLIRDGVDSKQIPGVIVEADICLCPLEDIEKFRWSYPVKIYEYMAMRKVVVAPKLPGIERMIKCKSVGGCLYDATDINNMINEVTWLIENPASSQKIARMGYDHAQSKSWDKILSSLAINLQSKILHGTQN